jgi:proline iminopeptidase
MDSSKMEYASYCFMHAMQNGFYVSPGKSNEAAALYKNLKADTALSKLSGRMTFQAPSGFYNNENYTTLDITPDLKNIVSKKINVNGIYGKDDGLFSIPQITSLHSILGEDKLLYLDNCSHNAFIDQQKKFIDAFKKWN